MMVKILEVPIHSFIDVITNSSTEMFVTASGRSVDMIKEMVQSIITLSGSDKKVDELFDIELTIGDDGIECPACVEERSWAEHYWNEEKEECSLCGATEKYDYGHFARKLRDGDIPQDVIDKLIEENQENRESPFSMSVAIYAKTLGGKDIGQDLIKLFEQQERMC